MAATPASPSGRRRSRRRELSFETLRDHVGKFYRGWADEPVGPLEVIVERPERLPGGMVRRIYRFEQADYEPDDLLVSVSRKYPRLCIVLGWVAPNVDEQVSKLIHRRRTRRHELSKTRREQLYGSIPEDDSDAFWASTEADWQAEGGLWRKRRNDGRKRLGVSSSTLEMSSS